VFISMKLNYNLYVNFDWCRKVPRGAAPCSSPCTAHAHWIE
jgi:hypothetical protein